MGGDGISGASVVVYNDCGVCVDDDDETLGGLYEVPPVPPPKHNDKSNRIASPVHAPQRESQAHGLITYTLYGFMSVMPLTYFQISPSLCSSSTWRIIGS